MKNVFLITFLVSFYACSSPAQKNKITVDGRAFKIETVVDGKTDGIEIMSFKNGQVENNECKKWGFMGAPYSFDDKNASFKYTLTSSSEGKMLWEGKINGNQINGQYVWMKAGQKDIHYTFKGEEMKQ